MKLALIKRIYFTAGNLNKISKLMNLYCKIVGMQNVG